jgi:hypothetical protein
LGTRNGRGDRYVFNLAVKIFTNPPQRYTVGKKKENERGGGNIVHKNCGWKF